MRLHENPQLPPLSSPTFLVALREYIARIHQQLNGLGDGRGSAVHSASTAAPTAGTWSQGDYVKNSAPTELGSAGSKYVVRGWINVASGTPGTWVQDRALTGN